mgnify:CR=1 FL=1
MSNFSKKDRERLIETHTMMKVVVDQMEDHEDRIRKSEKFRARLIGWVIGSGAGLTAVIEGVKTKFGG